MVLGCVPEATAGRDERRGVRANLLLQHVTASAAKAVARERQQTMRVKQFVVRVVSLRHFTHQLTPG